MRYDIPAPGYSLNMLPRRECVRGSFGVQECAREFGEGVVWLKCDIDEVLTCYMCECIMENVMGPLE